MAAVLVEGGAVSPAVRHVRHNTFGRSTGRNRQRRLPRKVKAGSGLWVCDLRSHPEKYVTQPMQAEWLELTGSETRRCAGPLSKSHIALVAASDS